ncbi:MAG: hypothetical protein KF841_01300 [Phycisphaerae bacterium]|nr:hypothetical protein [Phycisphaerae bacterium]
MRTYRSRIAICIALLLGLTAPSLDGVAVGQPATTTTQSMQNDSLARIVRSFDFDERKFGNYDSMPMNWRQIVEPGYPRFLEPRIDETIGHDAPPSFHLALQGGNLGAVYVGREIPIDPRCAYRIVGWIRPRGLKHAGAFISAHYLAADGSILPNTERRSDVARDNGEQWVEVSIDLAPSAEHARWISLACRVEQSPIGGEASESYKSIEHRDARGEAWFDDISVIRMPYVSLELNRKDSIFEKGEAPEASIRLSDVDGRGIRAELTLVNADGQPVEQREIDPSSMIGTIHTYRPSPLKYGRYTLRLTLHSEQHELQSVERSFVVLADALSDAQGAKSGFGIVLDGNSMSQPKAMLRWMEVLKPDRVKVPVWRADMNDETVLLGSAEFDRAVRSLHERGMGLAAVLESPPAGLAMQYPKGRRGLFHVLSEDSSLWQPYLAMVVTRYGLWVDQWQLGSDAVDPLFDRDLLKSAIRNSVNEVKPLIGSASFVLPQSSDSPMDVELDRGDIMAFAQPAHRPAEQVARQLFDVDRESSKDRWVTLQSLPSDRYERNSRLADFSRGLLLARCHGAATVFTRIPWQTRTTASGVLVEPTEELILLRTIFGILHGYRPVKPLRMGRGIEAWLLADESGKQGVVAAWTRGESPIPTHVRFDLGQDIEFVDLWGNRSTHSRSDDGNDLTLTAMPVLLRKIDPGIAQLAESLEIDEPSLPPRIKTHQRTIRLTNTTSRPLRGLIRFSAPAGWSLTPSSFPIDVQPGVTTTFTTRIRIPANQAVGEFELIGRLTAGVAGKALTLRVPVEVKSEELRVDVAAVRDVDGYKVIQRVTNMTSRPLDLKASLISPDHARQWRTISQLGAGESATRQYAVSVPAASDDRPIRVSVEQIGGEIRHHTLLNLK